MVRDFWTGLRRGMDARFCAWWRTADSGVSASGAGFCPQKRGLAPAGLAPERTRTSPYLEISHSYIKVSWNSG